MNMMLSPDLLDRRALALIEIIDIFGRPVEGYVGIAGPGIRFVRKTGGRIAITGAEGFAAHERSFAEAPSNPAIQSAKIKLELNPHEPQYAARSFVLELPRDTDPENREAPESVFATIPVTLPPGTGFVSSGSASVLRIAVTRKSNGMLVENALVRGTSDNGQFTASAVTNHAGEAALVFANIPLSFAGAGASVKRSLDGKVTVDVDPATARFHAPENVSAAAYAASKRISGQVDPDAMSASIAANFVGGTSVKIAAGKTQSVQLEWEQP